VRGVVTCEIVGCGGGRGGFRWTPLRGTVMPLWSCAWRKVQFERFPTNWGLPRAQVRERTCAARGDDACRWDVQWTNPSRGALFWTPSLIGGASAALLAAVHAPPT